MANVVIVGAQWGDEGKGKVVDIYTEYAQHVVRYQGGNNAGHTLVVGEARAASSCRWSLTTQRTIKNRTKATITKVTIMPIKVTGSIP